MKIYYASQLVISSPLKDTNSLTIFRSLDFSLDESVKPQDAHKIFESVFQSSNLGAKLALEFLVSNYKKLGQRSLS